MCVSLVAVFQRPAGLDPSQGQRWGIPSQIQAGKAALEHNNSSPGPLSPDASLQSTPQTKQPRQKSSFCLQKHILGMRAADGEPWEQWDNAEGVPRTWGQREWEEELLQPSQDPNRTFYSAVIQGSEVVTADPRVRRSCLAENQS